MTRSGIDEATSGTSQEPYADDVEDGLTRAVLEPLLRPVMRWLEIEEIEEIAINRPGEIWLRLRKPDESGAKWVARNDPALSRDRLNLIITSLANVNGTGGFGANGTPTVFGTLPGGHRFAGGVGPNFQYMAGEKSAQGTIVFTARQFRPTMPIRLEHYGIRAGVELDTIDALLHRKSDANDPLARIMASLKRGDHLLVSGATSTGKTTFLNHIIRMVDPHLRIVTVEDTSEIAVSQPNHLHILLDRGKGQANRFDYDSVVDLIKRLTPDVVMAGEISSTNAAAVWELMRTGHGHFFTTIHAESPEEALSSFVTNIGKTSPNEVKDRHRVMGEMKNRMRIVQLNLDPVLGRRITHVM